MRDVVVVGGGIIGLATAYRLLERRPDLDVIVLEKEREVGSHQSSHNSGVLHAGLYYAPGSLKARLCVSGKRDLEKFAATHGIAVTRHGKVVVAVDRAELPRLALLEERARANGVPGLRRLRAAELAEVEPHVHGLAALHSPATATIDFGAVCRALADEVRARGGEVLTLVTVQGLRERAQEVVVRTTIGALAARQVIACAGLQSDRVARLSGVEDREAIVPFRGSYLRLVGPAASLVRGHLYPVPLPGLPFLGVHVTQRHDGEVWVGPNAVVALARERYDRWAVDLRDTRDVIRHPGFWRLAADHLRTGVAEVHRDLSIAATARELRRYVPGVGVADLERGPSGIRAQSVRADGELVDDFSWSSTPRVLHVRNAPSPGATASLAIGRVIAERALDGLGGGSRAAS